MKPAIPVALCLAAIASTGSAVRAEPTTNFFAVASIGRSDTSYEPLINHLITGEDQSFELGVGYSFNPYLSLRGSYQDFGEVIGYPGCPPEVLCLAAFLPEPVGVDGWSASVVGTLPLNDRFSAFGKAGLIAWDTSAQNPMLDDSGEDLLYGAGLSWTVSDRWDVELSYERVELDIESGNIGARFRF